MVTIPQLLNMCEEAGMFRDFDRAAGKLDGAGASLHLCCAEQRLARQPLRGQRNGSECERHATPTVITASGRCTRQNTRSGLAKRVLVRRP